MSKRAWMPLYVGDYLGDTGHLSTVQHGAYLLLLMHYWRKGGLPDDDKQLAAITKLPLRIWMDNRETVQAFFHDGWLHKRMDAEIEKMERTSSRRAAAGREGGLKSAVGRMTLEYRAAGTGKQMPSKRKQLLERDGPSNASNCSNFATAGIEHSHSQSKITTSEVVEGRTGEGEIDGASRLNASAELVAILGKSGVRG